jgi:arylsulfatase
MFYLDGVAPSEGDCIVTLDARAVSQNIWDIRLLINNDEIARKQNLPMTGLMETDIGINRISPVDWDLGQRRGVFRYSGRLRTVTFTPGEKAPGRGPDQLEQLRQLAETMALQ